MQHCIGYSRRLALPPISYHKTYRSVTKSFNRGNIHKPLSPHTHAVGISYLTLAYLTYPYKDTCAHQEVNAPRDMDVLTAAYLTPSSLRTSGYRGCRSCQRTCARCIVAFLMGESVIRSLCQPEIGTQKGVSITVLMATVIFKLRR